ncbi:MAG: hypothetical protein ACO3D2_00440 [Holophagaceae bacterium]
MMPTHNTYDQMPPAEQALSILFKKLHPLLEDTAEALRHKPSVKVLTALHVKLMKARIKASEAIQHAAEQTDDEELSTQLETLSVNLLPVGENFRQSLTLTQLCLEEVPKDLVAFIPAGVSSQSPWGKRMIHFLEQLKEDHFHAEPRWSKVDDDIGETEEG